MESSRILARDLTSHIGKEASVRGFLNNIRKMGKLSFLLLKDFSGLIQIVIEDRDEQRKVESLQPGSILTIQGTVTSSKSSLTVELIHPKIVVENPILEVPPLEYYKPEMQGDLEFLLDHRSIALRNRQLQAIFKIQAEIAHAYRLFMHDEMCATEYFPPNLIGSSSEGGAEFFKVDYFGHVATLAQSSQLYKQIMVSVSERAFAIVPFFRAEPSQTTRHLAEGKQIEFEMGFFQTWHEIMDIQEACLRFILKHVNQVCQKDLAALGTKIAQVPENSPFPRLTFQNALELYFQRTGIDERNEPDLSPAAERNLCAWAIEEHASDFLFITDWKREKRPFYSYPSEENPSLTNTFDLLCSGVEITSGGQRRHTYESMVEGIREKNMKVEEFSDYLSIFKYGMPPHGGFGMGLERLTMTLLKLKNIREASLFPSDLKRIASNRIKAHIFYGGETIRNEIIRLCHQHQIPFQHLKHPETPTSEASATARDTTLEEGIKSIIVQGKSTKKNYQFNIPSHKRLDMKKVATVVGEKCEFEDPAIILERFGLKIGGIPPFGNLLGLDNYLDLSIQDQLRAAFNCGLLTESIILDSQSLKVITDPKWGNFSK